ncbi:MAG: hypothetical protein ACREMZ_03785 [Gemmatimonadales bacterium]
MPKPPPGREPDPMASVVDRLLAQLPGLKGEPASVQGSFGPFPTVVGGTPSTRTLQKPTQRELIGVWIRVFLGLTLGIMMAAWPYSRICGTPLLGYLGAVVAVGLAGGWAAAAAWRFRSGLAHVLSLILLLYGIMLAIAELLPRTGYALNQATWRCVLPG